MKNKYTGKWTADVNLTEFHEVKELEEKKLLMCIISRAVSDYVNLSAHIDRHHIREAGQWIFSQQRNDKWPFTFEKVCLFLDLDAEALREAIKSAKENLSKEELDRDSIQLLREKITQKGPFPLHSHYFQDPFLREISPLVPPMPRQDSLAPLLRLSA